MLGSPWLTAGLTVLICIDTAVGSFIVLRDRPFYEELDREILFPYLLKIAPMHPELTLWIFVLILLVALFAVNTTVCTIDKLYMILKKKAPRRALLPQLVHIGFLVALAGHLIGSIDGFRAYGNVAIEGEKVPVPNTEGLYMRLDGVDAEFSRLAGLTALSVSMTLLEDDQVVYTDVMSINDPLIYRGIAFYYVKHGRTLKGFIVDVDGRTMEVSPDGSFASPSGRIFYFGKIYSADDGSGRAVPFIEVIADNGKRGFLRLIPSSRVEIDGTPIALKDYVLATYGIFTINKDPGIWLIGAGSLMLVVGMVGLMFAREDRGELVG